MFGCDARGGSSLGHNEECRALISELIGKSPPGKRRLEAEEQRVWRQVRKEEEESNRKGDLLNHLLQVTVRLLPPTGTEMAGTKMEKWRMSVVVERMWPRGRICTDPGSLVTKKKARRKG